MWMGILKRVGTGRNDIQWGGSASLSTAGTYLNKTDWWNRNGLQWLYIFSNGTYPCLERIDDSDNLNNIRWANTIFNFTTLADFGYDSAVYTPTMDNVQYVTTVICTNSTSSGYHCSKLKLTRILSASGSTYQMSTSEYNITSLLLASFIPSLPAYTGAIGVIFSSAERANNWANFINTYYSNMQILYSNNNVQVIPLTRTTLKSGSYYDGEEFGGESLSYFYMAFIGLNLSGGITLGDWISRLYFY